MDCRPAASRSRQHGLKNKQQRADLLAFMKLATQPGQKPPQTAHQQDSGMGDGGGGMMGGGGGGMMGGASVPNLKKLDPEDRVQAIQYCGDTYKVYTSRWKDTEFLGAKSAFQDGFQRRRPAKSTPALVDAGMMGDRADVIFADPQEITSIITHQC
jgi:cytochrome c